MQQIASKPHIPIIRFDIPVLGSLSLSHISLIEAKCLFHPKLFLFLLKRRCFLAYSFVLLLHGYVCLYNTQYHFEKYIDFYNILFRLIIFYISVHLDLVYYIELVSL